MTAGYWWILLFMAAYGSLHSLLASRRFKRWLQGRFGPGVMRWHRLIFSVLGGLTILPALAMVVWLPDRVIYTIPYPLSSWFKLLQLIGLFGVVYAVLQTGFFNFIGLNHALNPASLQQPRRLVTGGLYRLVRHPIYTFAMLFLWASPNLSWNKLALNIGISIYFVIGSIFEEQKLLDEFGEAYADYRRRTGAFLLRLTGPSKPEPRG
jgi:protein-S-isoprenylcysteine O-methyltransferase Ste14